MTTTAGLPKEVQEALDRMCMPLDASVLTGATAKRDAECMATIRTALVELQRERDEAIEKLAHAVNIASHIAANQYTANAALRQQLDKIRR